MSSYVKIEQSSNDVNEETNFKHNILCGTSEIFINSPFDNVIVHCGDGASVSTSAVLLAVISPWLKSLMESTSFPDEFCICIPSVSSDDLVNSIRNITEDRFIDAATFSLLEFLKPENYVALSPGDIEMNQPLIRSVDCLKLKGLTSIIPEDKIERIKKTEDIEENNSWGFETNICNGKDTQMPANGLKRKRGRPKKEEIGGSESQFESSESYLSTPDENLEDDENKRPLSLLCQDCGKVFKNNNYQDRHKYDNHIAKHKIEKFTCDCDAQLSTLAEREKHMKVDHLGWFGCPQCLLCFKSKEIQEKHSDTHSLSFICDICGYIGNTKSNLAEHTKRIHETNPVKCPDCDKIFKNDQRLMHHKRKVHMARQCPICGEIFKTLRVHLNTVHKTDSEKKYQCQECGKGFYDRSKLESHRMSIHIKSRPHRCRYGCDIGYNDVSNRNSHEKKKHGGLFLPAVSQA